LWGGTPLVRGRPPGRPSRWMRILILLPRSGSRDPAEPWGPPTKFLQEFSRGENGITSGVRPWAPYAPVVCLEESD